MINAALIFGGKKGEMFPSHQNLIICLNIFDEFADSQTTKRRLSQNILQYNNEFHCYDYISHNAIVWRMWKTSTGTRTVSIISCSAF